MKNCPHSSLYKECSPAAKAAGFTRSTPDRRLLALSATGRRARGNLLADQEATNDPWTFPGPLVLPDDDLALEPDQEGQTVKGWHDMIYTADRNGVTSRRKKIYVILPPMITQDMENEMKDWHLPVLPASSSPSLERWTSASAKIEDLLAYLGAFYHPMEIVQSGAKFTWRNSPATTTIGLETPDGAKIYPVRCRPSPDGLARMQMHLGDVTDALLHKPPTDAYCTVMITDHDLYEDNEDEFTVGRSWGLDRISVVSAFRYNPALDASFGIDRAHMWPNSHCKLFVDEQCGVSDTRRQRRSKGSNNEKPAGVPPADSALALAVKSSKSVPAPTTRDELGNYWFSRLAITVSHEIGHCFGLDHCTYYACVMQGVSSIRQDGQVPPYLCPICAAKIGFELGALVPGFGTRMAKQQVWLGEQYAAMREYCHKWNNVPQFAGLESWLGKRLEDMNGEGDEAGPSQ
ncbi:hypothetical protein IL306_002401 [Fusarium sp. DS 682]|nr:hypothetical protein IL306_002401 [Fusarium sp. DS 682]